MKHQASTRQNEPKLIQRIQELEVSEARLAEKSTALLNILEDLVEARQNAEQNERQFRTLFENLSDGILVIDQRTKRVELANQSACDMLGYTLAEIRSLEFVKAHPDFDPLDGVFMAERTASFSLPRLIQHVRRKDGSTFPAEARASYIEIGGHTYLMCVFHDITERLLAEQRVAQGRDFYLKVLDEAPVLIWKSNALGELEWFNESWLRFSGRSLQDELAAGWRISVHPDDLPELETRYLGAIESRCTFKTEYRLCRYDGEYRWILEMGNPVLDPDGRFIGFLGYCFDITDRKKSEQALQQRTEEIRLLYDAGHQLTSTLDLSLVFEKFHNIVARVMDCIALYVSSYDPEDQMIHCVFAVQNGKKLDPSKFPSIPLATEGKGTQSLVIRSGNSLVVSDYLQQRSTSSNYYYVANDGNLHKEKPEGEDVARSALIVPMKIEGQVTGVIQVFSYQFNTYSDDDLRFLEALAIQTSAAIHNASLYQRAQAEIKERRRIELALRESEQQIRASLAEKEVLLREIHHRVKNNLEVVISLADMQARGINDLEALQNIRELQERVRTIALVHEDLYRSKNLANIKAQSYIQRLTDNLFQVFGSAGMNLEVQSEDLSLNVDLAIPFGLIITELLTNAIKHAFPDRLSQNTVNGNPDSNLIQVFFFEEGDSYVLEVRDNGCGFPPGLDWRTTRSLGLRLVNRLAEQLHGSLEVKSELGTCVRLNLAKAGRGIGYDG